MYQAVKREERYDKYSSDGVMVQLVQVVVEVIDTNGERIAQRIGDALNVKYVFGQSEIFQRPDTGKSNS